MRSVLLVTRNFAPTSHVSVERAIKLVKYLPEFGWRPTVLTGATPTDGLPSDPHLVAQVSGIDIIRARAPEFSLFYRSRRVRRSGAAPAIRSAPKRGKLHPKAWLVPDSQVMWWPFAVRAALEHRAAPGWDAVVGMCSPPTALLIARTIAGRLDIPYLADMRDSWTGYHGAPLRPAPLALFERRLESRVLAGAASVVTVDRSMVGLALERLPRTEQPPVHVIPNGYDEDDFQDTPAAELPRLSIVHTGQLRHASAPLWEAIGGVLASHPELRGELHFWQVGFVDPSAAAMLERPPDGLVVHLVPPVSQREAVSYMLGADLLLAEEVGTVLPSKALQYLRAGRPILAFVDGGGLMRELLAAAPQACVVARDETGCVADLIVRLAAEPRAASSGPTPAVLSYSRREIARRFAEVLEAACDPQPAPARPAGTAPAAAGAGS
jgi:glycosyltransferase involved in cell wall biosynthesis